MRNFSLKPSKINQRMLLYAAIALVSTVIPELLVIKESMINGESILFVDWLIIGLKSLLAGFIAVRAFIDESPVTHNGTYGKDNQVSE